MVSENIITVQTKGEIMKTKLLIAGLMFFSLILNACASISSAPAAEPTAVPISSGGNFPTGKFIKSGETNYGLNFKADGTFLVFQGDEVFVTGTYKADDKMFTETSNTGGP